MDELFPPLWPIRPLPLHDELLTSWLVRLAQAYGLTPHSFCSRVFGKGISVWNRDFDRFAPVTAISTIAAGTGQAEIRVFDMTLRPYLDGQIAFVANEGGIARWILPMGIYHRTRTRYAQLYCPRCLAEDKVPYYRRCWRLAFYTICDRHDILIRDQCPACASPVMFHRSATDLKHCHRCDHDLSRSAAYSPPIGDIHAYLALRALCTYHDLGWAFLGKETFHYSHLLLDALHSVCSLLIGRHGKALFTIATQKAGFPDSRHPRSQAAFECYPLIERHYVLLTALWLLMDWPQRFIDACRGAGLTESRIVEKEEALPWWFYEAVHDELNKTPYAPQANEVENAASFLRKTERRVTRSSVSALMGVRGSRAIEQALRSQKPAWPVSPEDYEHLIALACRKVASLPRRSLERNLTERDLLILRLMQITRKSPRQILVLTVAELGAVPLRDVESKKLLQRYLNQIRPALMSPRRPTDSAFPGLRSGGIQVKSFGVRLAKLRGFGVTPGN